MIDIGLQQTRQSVLVNSLPAEKVGDSAPTPPVGCINGTIWSMCFISKHSDELSKERNPVLAILVTRYDDQLCQICEVLYSYLCLGVLFYFNIYIYFLQFLFYV